MIWICLVWTNCASTAFQSTLVSAYVYTLYSKYILWNTSDDVHCGVSYPSAVSEVCWFRGQRWGWTDQRTVNFIPGFFLRVPHLLHMYRPKKCRWRWKPWPPLLPSMSRISWWWWWCSIVLSDHSLSLLQHHHPLSRVSQSDDRYRCQSGTPHGSSFSILVLSVDYQLIPPSRMPNAVVLETHYWCWFPGFGDRQHNTYRLQVSLECYHALCTVQCTTPRISRSSFFSAWLKHTARRTPKGVDDVGGWECPQPIHNIMQ